MRLWEEPALHWFRIKAPEQPGQQQLAILLLKLIQLDVIFIIIYDPPINWHGSSIADKFNCNVMGHIKDVAGSVTQIVRITKGFGVQRNYYPLPLHTEAYCSHNQTLLPVVSSVCLEWHFSDIRSTEERVEKGKWARSFVGQKSSSSRRGGSLSVTVHK